MSIVNKLLSGQPDPRGQAGIMARGNNVYRAGSNAAHSGGGPQFGRPPKTPPTNYLNNNTPVRPGAAMFTQAAIQRRRSR